MQEKADTFVVSLLSLHARHVYLGSFLHQDLNPDAIRAQKLAQLACFVGSLSKAHHSVLYGQNHTNSRNRSKTFNDITYLKLASAEVRWHVMTRDFEVLVSTFKKRQTHIQGKKI